MRKSMLATCEDKIAGLVARYVKAGGDYRRIIALIEHAHKPRTGPAEVSAPKPAVNAPTPRTAGPFPEDSVFNIRIGTRVLGTVRVEQYGVLADRAEGDMRLWSKLKAYALENKLNPKATTASIIPARVLNRMLRETSQRIAAAA